MMRGTAVVASDVGGLAESVVHEETGLRVPAGDEHALADALVRLLTDRSLAEQYGDAGRARAHALFTLDACTTRFERLYDALRSSTPSPAHVS
jgi:glycosyltransferase involved in cell wall biosynthesis